MDLETFIAETLISINNGVKRAQTHSSMGNTKVVPGSVWINEANGGTINHVFGVEDRKQQVEFDVAITINEGSSQEGKIGVFGGWAGASVGKGSNENQSTATKVKFTIPISIAVS